MEDSMKRSTRAALLLLLLLALPAILWRLWPVSRETAYQFYRSYGKARVLSSLVGYETLTSERFFLYFTDQDRDIAPIVLETAEEMYDFVIESIGFRPPGRAVIVVYPDRSTFRQAFGWGAEESALGVYHAGTVRLLSPHAWIKRRSLEEKRKAFRALGPVAHELSHYVLDYLTNGNYPRWFTEGLAQRIEHQLTGYLWLEEESSLRQRLYSLRELESNFDRLPNQPLAYRQSYLLVDFMAAQFGEESLRGIIRLLADGEEFRRVVRVVTGQPMLLINDRWARWVELNLDRLDPPG
jgi:plasmid stabilization system protein ParE